jgi:putative DNA primase/helicase
MTNTCEESPSMGPPEKQKPGGRRADAGEGQNQRDETSLAAPQPSGQCGYIDWSRFHPGRQYRLRCPADCRPDKPASDRTCSLRMDDDGRGGVARCFRCGSSWYSLPGRSVAPTAPHRPVAQPPQRYTHLNRLGHALWAAAGPIVDVGRDYLLARGCRLPPDDGDLRYHPALKHPGGHVGPALLGLVTHVRTRLPLSIHQTWVRADGTKEAAANPPRLFLRGHNIAGGVIRLWPDEAVDVALGIAEGAETALACAHSFTPMWSVLDAGHMAAFPVLPGIECLTTWADNDPAGLAAAKACADRWALAGVDVRILAAEHPGCDWNDAQKGWETTR